MLDKQTRRGFLFGAGAVCLSSTGCVAHTALSGAKHDDSLSIIMSDAIHDVPNEQRSTAMGFYQSVYAVGIMAGPALMGSLIDAIDITPAFGVVGAVCVVTAVAYPLIRRFAER